jgi:hypothetical protein
MNFISLYYLFWATQKIKHALLIWEKWLFGKNRDVNEECVWVLYCVYTKSPRLSAFPRKVMLPGTCGKIHSNQSCRQQS